MYHIAQAHQRVQKRVKSSLHSVSVNSPVSASGSGFVFYFLYHFDSMRRKEPAAELRLGREPDVYLLLLRYELR